MVDVIVDGMVDFPVPWLMTWLIFLVNTVDVKVDGMLDLYRHTVDSIVDDNG